MGVAREIPEERRRSRYVKSGTLSFVTERIDIPIQAEKVPGYAHPGDAGADIRSTEQLTLAPGERALVGTGIRLALPEGYAAFVVPRSGLAVKHGVTVLNSPGTIDAGYRGEVKVPLINHDVDTSFEIAPGDRIAQLIIMPVSQVNFVQTAELSESIRGAGGFGSTGVAHALPSERE